MRKIIVSTVLALFLVSFYGPSVALAQNDEKFADETARENIKAAGKKIKGLVEKYQKLELDKYNELTVTAVDTDGNKPNCEMRVYYNDFKQEKFQLKNGQYNGLFNHEKTFPTKVLSVGFEDCTCRVQRIDIAGPIYPEITESIDKVKKIVEDEVGEKITGAASDFAKEQAEKALGHLFEGLGYGGSAMAKRFLGAVGVGAELGAPINDFISKEIEKIFAGVRREAELNYKGTKDQTPLRPRANTINARWGISNLGGLTRPTPFTQFNINAVLKCPKYGTDKLHWQDGRYFKPITNVVKSAPITPPKPEPKVEEEFDIEEYNRRIQEQNEAREKWEKEMAERREAYEKEQTAKAAAAAEAKAKAERIAAECKKCESIKKAWEAKQAEYDQAWDDYNNARDELSRLQIESFKLEKKTSQAQRALNDFNDPSGAFVESEGRRVDETDLALKDAAAAQGWDRYQAGEISAQELSDYWGSLDKDAIENLRAKVKAQMEADVKAAQDAQAANKKAQATQEAAMAKAKQAVADRQAEADQLESAYKDCLKTCREDKTVNILQDYGIKVEEEKPAFAWLPWNWDEEGEISIQVDPVKIAVVPDYSAVTYESLGNPLHQTGTTQGENPLHEEKSLTGSDTHPFHSVLQDLGTGPVVTNQQQIGATGRLISVSPQKSLNESIPADGTQNGGEGGFGAALQILLDDGTTDPDDQLGITFSPGIQDLPEVTEVAPERDKTPASNFVLTFSEPMDTQTVEDNFIVRSFPADQTNYTDPAPNPAEDFGGNIWDDSHFDVDWNSDDTQATFTFKDERTVEPPKKRKVIIIIIIDRRAKQAGLVNAPDDYFQLPDNALNPAFENAPPLDSDIFVDGFESGNTTAWVSPDPDRPVSIGGGLSGEELDSDPNFEALAGPINNLLNGEPTNKAEEKPPVFCADDQYPDDGTCGESGIFDGEDGYAARCSGHQKCEFKNTLSDNTKCYGCVNACAVGQFVTNNCANSCANNQVCVPADADSGQCYECIGRPTDLTEPIEEEEEKIELVVPPIEQCVPKCDGRTCGNDGCGGSCGSCSADAVCNANGQCDAPQCPDSSFMKTQCNNCEAGCQQFPNPENLPCYTCKDNGPVEKEEVFISPPVFEEEVIEEEEVFQCPLGSLADESRCNSQCSNGACNDNGGGCYSCLQCDSGSFSTQAACETDGSNCEVGGTQGNLSCWVPVASCSDLCSQNGLSAEPIDFTSQVEAQLNAQNCVSSYSMQITQGTVGDCSCFSPEPPAITFDTTPPVCTGTVCGDVTCGQSVSCPVDEGTATVSCSWGGWQKEAQYQYRPLIGGN